MWQNCSDSADWKEKHPEAPETSETCVQAKQDGPTSANLSNSRRDSHLGIATTFEPMAPPLAELQIGKRTRKLKKRKLLKKAQWAEPPESSDTELDGEALKPRWLRPRQRPSSGTQLSTSSSPPSEKFCGTVEETTPEQEQGEKRTPRHGVKCLLVASTIPSTTNFESDENMEVCPQSHTDNSLPLEPSALKSYGQQQQQSLGCNEVTSTSDMDICKSSERYLRPHKKALGFSAFAEKLIAFSSLCASTVTFRAPFSCAPPRRRPPPTCPQTTGTTTCPLRAHLRATRKA